MKVRYNIPLIAGTICAGGTLEILIPPSIMLVVYGSLTQISVGWLYAAAFTPGLYAGPVAGRSLRDLYCRDLYGQA